MDNSIASTLLSLGPPGILALVLFIIHRESMQRNTDQQDKDRAMFREELKISHEACERRHLESTNLARDNHEEVMEAHKETRHGVTNLAHVVGLKNAVAEAEASQRPNKPRGYTS